MATVNLGRVTADSRNGFTTWLERHEEKGENQFINLNNATFICLFPENSMIIQFWHKIHNKIAVNVDVCLRIRDVFPSNLFVNHKNIKTVSIDYCKRLIGGG